MFYTVKEVATLLKVHWQTVRNYIKSGQLATFRVGKSVRISQDALTAFVQGRTTDKENNRRPTKKLIVVADDFGQTTSINQGIFFSLKNGFLKEISMTVGYPATIEAAGVIKKHHLKNVGLYSTSPNVSTLHTITTPSIIMRNVFSNYDIDSAINVIAQYPTIDSNFTI